MSGVPKETQSERRALSIWRSWLRACRYQRVIGNSASRGENVVLSLAARLCNFNSVPEEKHRPGTLESRVGAAAASAQIS